MAAVAGVGEQALTVWTGDVAQARSLPGGRGRAAALAGVQLLARTAGSDPAADIARRLARRMQYADVAGGPIGRW